MKTDLVPLQMMTCENRIICFLFQHHIHGTKQSCHNKLFIPGVLCILHFVPINYQPSVLENQGAKDTRGSSSQHLLSISFHIRIHFHTYTFPTLVAHSWGKEVRKTKLGMMSINWTHSSPCDQVGCIQGCLTALAKVIAKPLCHLQKVMMHWHIPDDWKRANIGTLFKKGKKVQ